MSGFKVTQRAAGTLIGQVEKVDLSFFYYPYPLIHALEKSECFYIASVADIACMKLIAISQRGLRRDFVDLFVICQITPLAQVFHWPKKNIRNLTLTSVSKGLYILKTQKPTNRAGEWSFANPLRGKKSGHTFSTKLTIWQRNGYEEPNQHS